MTRVCRAKSVPGAPRRRQALGVLAVTLVLLAGLLACESPPVPAVRAPGPANPPAGSLRELQNAILAHNDIWAASRLAEAAVTATPRGGIDISTERIDLARTLIDKLAPLLEQALVVIEPSDDWLRFDDEGRYAGGHATMRAVVQRLGRFRQGEGLAAWTERVADEPGADPRGVVQSHRLTLYTYWIEEQDQWRLRHLALRDPQADELWVLPARGATRLPPALTVAIAADERADGADPAPADTEEPAGDTDQSNDAAGERSAP